MTASGPNAARTAARASLTLEPRNVWYCTRISSKPFSGGVQGHGFEGSDGRVRFELAERQDRERRTTTLREGAEIATDIGARDHARGATGHLQALHRGLEREAEAAGHLGVERAAGAGRDLAQRAAEHLFHGRVEDQRLNRAVMTLEGVGNLTRQALANELRQLLGVARAGRELDQAFRDRADISDRDAFTEQVAEDLQHFRE